MYYYLVIYDSIEILFYSVIIYAFCLWLKTDKTKPLLWYFLGYCTLTIAAWVLELPTLAPFLISYAPISLLLFIVLHERTLQKNLVTLCTITPQQSIHDWLDILVSSALTIINQNKALTFVIENKDSLDCLLTSPFFMNAPISKELFALLLSSTSYDEKKIVWITAHGLLRSINATWPTMQGSSENSASTLFNKQDALFYSLQCDALIIHINQFTRYFTLITQGKEIQNISVREIKHSIKKYLLSPNPLHSKGALDESNPSKKSLMH